MHSLFFVQNRMIVEWELTMKKWLYLVVACVILSGITIAVVQIVTAFNSNDNEKVIESKMVEKKEVKKPTFEELLREEQAIVDINEIGVNVKSKQALLVDLQTNDVIFAKNAEEKAYPASLTKLMTVLVGIEQIKDLQTKVTVPTTIFDYIAQANASVAGFNPGEQVTAEDLLNGIMLPSGADASLAIAIHVAGSEEKFVKLMNEEAKKLGMTNTNFKNVEGLHDAEHYTTAHDLMKLMKYSIRNDDFRKILTAQKYQVKNTNTRAQGFSFSSTLFSKLDLTKERGYTILGGKTGYTTEGGLALATLTEKNNKEYALVTMSAAGTNRTAQFNIMDALTVYGAIPTK